MHGIMFYFFCLSCLLSLLYAELELVCDHADIGCEAEDALSYVDTSLLQMEMHLHDEAAVRKQSYSDKVKQGPTKPSASSKDHDTKLVPQLLTQGDVRMASWWLQSFHQRGNAVAHQDRSDLQAEGGTPRDTKRQLTMPMATFKRKDVLALLDLEVHQQLGISGVAMILLVCIVCFFSCVVVGMTVLVGSSNSRPTALKSRQEESKATWPPSPNSAGYTRPAASSLLLDKALQSPPTRTGKPSQPPSRLSPGSSSTQDVRPAPPPSFFGDSPSLEESRPSTGSKNRQRTPPPMLPTMILPRTEARFMLPLDSLKGPLTGPLEILGSSGRKLLQATTSRTSDGRHCLAVASIGCEHDPWTLIIKPLPTGVLGTSSSSGVGLDMDVYGKSSGFYGHIQSEPLHESNSSVLHHGESFNPVMYFGMRDREDLCMTAMSAEGDFLASSQRATGEGLGISGDIWGLTVQPGADALLIMSCMLAIILMKPQ